MKKRVEKKKRRWEEETQRSKKRKKKKRSDPATIRSNQRGTITKGNPTSSIKLKRRKKQGRKWKNKGGKKLVIEDIPQGEIAKTVQKNRDEKKKRRQMSSAKLPD